MIFPNKSATKGSSERSVRGVSSLLGFLIGFVILIAVIIPLMMNISSSPINIAKIIDSYEDFQNLRSLEKLSVEADYASQSEIFYLRNSGSIPIKIIRALALSSGTSQPIMYTLSLELDPGQRIPLSNVLALIGVSDPTSLIYLVSSRGSVFFIAEQIIKLPPPIPSSPQQPQTGSVYAGGNPFTPPTSLFYWNFSNAIKNNRIEAYYSKQDASCSNAGIPANTIISNYPYRVLTINESSKNVVTYYLNGKGASGCAKFVFKDLLNVDGSYVITVYYRVVLSSLIAKDRVSIELSFSIVDKAGNIVSGTVTSFQWAPKTDLDYITYSGYVAIPIFGSSVSGNVDLVMQIVLTQISSNGVYQAGLEYLAFQGVRVNPVSVS